MESESRSLAGELAELRRKFLELEERYAKITARSEQYDDSSENPDQEFFTEVADSSVLATGARSGFRDKNTECSAPSNRSAHNNRGTSNAREKNDEFRGVIRERDGLQNKASGERRDTNKKPQSHSNADKNSSGVNNSSLPIDSELILADDLILVDDPTSICDNIINEEADLSQLEDELFLLQCEDDEIHYINYGNSSLNQDNLSNDYQTSPNFPTANKHGVAKENANTIGRKIGKIFLRIVLTIGKWILYFIVAILYWLGTIILTGIGISLYIWLFIGLFVGFGYIIYWLFCFTIWILTLIS